MASVSTKQNIFDQRRGIYVQGYIRENFDKNHWIDEIIQIIIQFYWTNNGSLFMCGQGDGGRLGIKEYENKICKELTVCSPFDDMNALDVSAGDYHTLMLDIDGNVWSCGNGDYGALGTGKEEQASTPQKIPLSQTAIQVAAGVAHSLILLSNGYVESFGYGMSGCLGHGNNENVFAPKIIASLTNHKIVKIVAGDDLSACLSEAGALFCFGDNQSGQCGVGKEKGTNIMLPIKIEFDKKIEFIACGSTQLLFVTSDNLPYSFGSGSYGKLGHEDKGDKFIPTLIEALSDKSIIMCGCGYYHSICIDKKRIVWSFGDNEYGQCGLPLDIPMQSTPKVIDYFAVNNIKAAECYVGCCQSSIIAQDGSCYVFGSNEKHELGLNDAENYFTPTKLSMPKKMSVRKISMGQEYIAMICS